MLKNSKVKKHIRALGVTGVLVLNIFAFGNRKGTDFNNYTQSRASGTNLVLAAMNVHNQAIYKTGANYLQKNKNNEYQARYIYRAGHPKLGYKNLNNNLNEMGTKTKPYFIVENAIDLDTFEDFSESENNTYNDDKVLINAKLLAKILNQEFMLTRNLKRSNVEVKDLLRQNRQLHEENKNYRLQKTMAETNAREIKTRNIFLEKENDKLKNEIKKLKELMAKGDKSDKKNGTKIDNTLDEIENISIDDDEEIYENERILKELKITMQKNKQQNYVREEGLKTGIARFNNGEYGTYNNNLLQNKTPTYKDEYIYKDKDKELKNLFEEIRNLKQTAAGLRQTCEQLKLDNDKLKNQNEILNLKQNLLDIKKGQVINSTYHKLYSENQRLKEAIYDFQNKLEDMKLKFGNINQVKKILPVDYKPSISNKKTD